MAAPALTKPKPAKPSRHLPDWSAVPPRPDMPPREAFSGGLPGMRDTCEHERAYVQSGTRAAYWWCPRCGAQTTPVLHEDATETPAVEGFTLRDAESRSLGDPRGGAEWTPQKAEMMAERLTALADGMQNEINKLALPAHDGKPLTHKRVGEIEKRERDYLEALHVQASLRALAEAWKHRDIPAILSAIRHKQIVVALGYSTWISGLANVNIPSGRFDEAKEQLARLIAKYETMKGAPDAGELERRRLERKVLLANIPGFFPTPAGLARKMVDFLDLEDGDTVLDPSAGMGNLLEMVRPQESGIEHVTMYACEINADLRAILEAKGYPLVGWDFLHWTPDDEGQRPTKVIMNPPFEGDAAIAHVRYAHKVLRAGGRLVALIPAGLTNKTTAKAKEFAAWLANQCEHRETIANAFAKGQKATGVSVELVVLHKLAD